MRRASLLVAAPVLLAGCSMAPPLEVPLTPVTETYKYGARWSEAVPADHMPRGAWWRGFADPTLDELIARADLDNPGLAAAVARLERAQAEARLASADTVPHLGSSARLSRERLSSGRPVGPGHAVTSEQYVLGGALSYELDLWGRVQNEARAGEASASAEAANLASVHLSLRAAVADAYFELRGLDAQMRLLKHTVEAFAAADRLIALRHEGGIASGVDRSRSQSLLANARAGAHAIAAQRAAVENRIAALVGVTPAELSIEPRADLAELPAVAPSLPSTLLERRPDIARAQRSLIAANARIGAAKAALYPRFDLALAAGFQANGMPLVSAPTGYWALGPLSAVLSLFDGGLRRAQVDISEADYRALAAGYRETVLNAFREVEDALAAASSLEAQEAERRTAAQAAARGSDLALDRYRDGATDYLEVVTAQTAALDAEQAYIDVQVSRRRGVVRLVRALGGDFDAGGQVADRAPDRAGDG
ncbi:efflux transporter outer membrane subunit [Pelagerythrobacter aerophilus]